MDCGGRSGSGGVGVSGDGRVGIWEARAEHETREGAENKAAWKKGVRFGVIAAKQFFTAKLHRVVAADQGEVVRNFIPTGNREAGQKDTRPQVIHKTGDLESGLPGFVRNDVQGGEIKLEAGFVLSRRAKLMIPTAQVVVVIVVNRTARREAGERVHVGILLQVVSKPVG